MGRSAPPAATVAGPQAPSASKTRAPPGTWLAMPRRTAARNAPSTVRNGGAPAGSSRSRIAPASSQSAIDSASSVGRAGRGSLARHGPEQAPARASPRRPGRRRRRARRAARRPRASSAGGGMNVASGSGAMARLSTTASASRPIRKRWPDWLTATTCAISSAVTPSASKSGSGRRHPESAAKPTRCDRARRRRQRRRSATATARGRCWRTPAES